MVFDAHSFIFQICFFLEQIGVSLASYVVECKGGVAPWVISDDVLRVLHTLKGCANMAAIEPIAPVVTKTENFVKELRLQDKKANEDVINLIATVIEFTNQVIEEIPKVTQSSHDQAAIIIENIAVLAETLLFGDGAGEVEGDSGKQERIEKFLTFAFDNIFDGEDFLAEYFDAQNNEDKKQSNADDLNTVAQECINISRYQNIN